jgi:hypothetical protein
MHHVWRCDPNRIDIVGSDSLTPILDRSFKSKIVNCAVAAFDLGICTNHQSRFE